MLRLVSCRREVRKKERRGLRGSTVVRSERSRGGDDRGERQMEALVDPAAGRDSSRGARGREDGGGGGISRRSAALSVAEPSSRGGARVKEEARDKAEPAANAGGRSGRDKERGSGQERSSRDKERGKEAGGQHRSSR